MKTEMQNVLANTTHLRDRMSRYQCQERFMSSALNDLQGRLEHWHREASFHQLGDTAAADEMLSRCDELETDCDTLATELVHVRMAMSGIGEEIDHHDARLLQHGIRISA